MADKEYQRLTGSRLRWRTFNAGVAVISPLAASALSVRSNLWLGKDHLLSIDTNGYTESYKRFYFRDIQAFTLIKTRRRMILTVILGIFTSLFVIIAIAANDAIGSSILGSVAALSLALLIVNLAKGPSCACLLRTAVQIESLPSLNRIRSTRKILARLQPLITEAQGQLAPEEIPARMQALTAAASAGTSAAASTPEPTRYIVDDLNLPPRIVS